MARRAFQMIDVVEILQHWHAGRPKLVLSASLGGDPKTVRKYVAPAEAEGIRPGDGLVLDRAGWAAKVAVWFPELTDSRARSSTWPALEARYPPLAGPQRCPVRPSHGPARRPAGPPPRHQRRRRRDVATRHRRRLDHLRGRHRPTRRTPTSRRRPNAGRRREVGVLRVGRCRPRR